MVRLGSHQLAANLVLFGVVFRNIKSFTCLLLIKERHSRLVRQGWRFFVSLSGSFDTQTLLVGSYCCVDSVRIVDEARTS